MSGRSIRTTVSTTGIPDGVVLGGLFARRLLIPDDNSGMESAIARRRNPFFLLNLQAKKKHAPAQRVAANDTNEIAGGR
jgi:hypothetical protein